MSGEKRFTLRMDADLFEELTTVAKKHRRSTAKEVEHSIALYLRDLAKKSFLDNLDLDNMSAEESKENLRELRDMLNKYDIFIG